MVVVSIQKQIETGKLVCPLTKSPLLIDQSSQILTTADRKREYALIESKVPILLVDDAWAKEYALGSQKMTQEYVNAGKSKKNSWWAQFKTELNGRFSRGYRSRASGKAYVNFFSDHNPESLFLSVGGGPGRVHPSAVNLNIGPFPNVDVVADAHLLPYADESVDAILCVAVLEHLSDPVQAVREMFRVLKPGAKVFIETPFLQAYHGYPYHFQNFTITGHQHLFKTNGFNILEAGCSVGPVFAMTNFVMVFILEYLPKRLAKLIAKFWFVIGTLLVMPLDKFIVDRENAHIMASGTYLVAHKSKST